MKKSFLYIAALLFCAFAAGAKEEFYLSSPNYLWESQINVPVLVHDNVYFDGANLRSSPRAEQVTLSTVFTLSLFLNLENQVRALGRDFRVRVRVQSTFYNRSNFAFRAQTDTLQIYYSTGADMDDRKDELRIERNDIAKIEIRITDIVITNAAGEHLALADFREIVRIKPQLKIERYYKPVVNNAPFAIGSAGQSFYTDWDNTTGEIFFYCYPNYWTEQVEIEWCYQDNYLPNLNSEKRVFDFNFKNNSTRITLDSCREGNRLEYRVPILYDRGVLLFRTRSTGKWHSGDPHNPSRVEGLWSLPDNYRLNLNNPPASVPRCWMQLEPYHNNNKMWQRIATFAENGKHKQVVSHLDGSLRDRASFVNLSTDRLWLLSQKLYDHQGRPTVQILPFPLIPSTVEFPLQNRPATFREDKLNRSDANTLYDRDNFDRDLDACNLRLDPLGNRYGAGRYYSPLNTDTTGFQSFTPDAEGYPFMQVEYTPDNTGRIRRQGVPGKNHQLGSGHEQVYYYSVPAQKELDIIFGNDAGYAQHYKKTAMLDANRQMYVTYTDIDGKTVATALAGTAPANLDSIERPAPQIIDINLSKQSNQLDPDGISLTANQTLVVASPTVLNLHYQIGPTAFTDLSCGFCFDCVYDLSISIRDECGNLLYETQQRIGNLDDPNRCNNFSFLADTVLTLQPGSYSISKRLSVNEQVADAYAEYYIENNPCLRSEEVETRDRFLAGVRPEDCDSPCTECPEVTVEEEYPLDDGTVIKIPSGIQSQASGFCAPACPGELPSPCKVGLTAMLNDLSPGGQYATYSRGEDGSVQATDPTSVLNKENILPFNIDRRGGWREPIPFYANPDGSRAYVELPKNVEGQTPRYIEDDKVIDLGNGNVLAPPENLNTLGDFLQNWQASWATALLVYHPEYKYLRWCRANEDLPDNEDDAFAYERMLTESQTYEEARRNGAGSIFDPVKPMEAINADPFFVLNPETREVFRDSLLRFSCRNESANCTDYYTITEAVYLVCHCSNPAFEGNEQLRAACMANARLFAGDERSDAREWQQYSAYYRAKRRSVIDALRQREAIASPSDGFDNAVIGNRQPANNPYHDKRRIFDEAKNAKNHLRTDLAGEEGYADSYQDFITFSQNWRRSNCNVCPVGSDMEAVLNAFAMEKRLTERGVRLAGDIPLVLTRRLTERFNPPNRPEYFWMPSVTGNRLIITIRDGNKSNSTIACRIVLENTEPSRPVRWEEIDMFTCLTPDANPAQSNNFTIKAYFISDNRTVNLRGNISCARLNDCSDAELGAFCQRSDRANQIQTLMAYLFDNRRFAQPIQQDREFPLLPIGGSVRFVPTRVEETLLRGHFLASDHIVTSGCSFDFRILGGGLAITHSFADIVRIVELKKNDAEVKKDDPCFGLQNFILIAEDNQGRQFEIFVYQRCLDIFNCCLFGPDYEADPDLCCFEFSPRLPYRNNCEEQLRLIARMDAEREIERRRVHNRQIIRDAYIEHCLTAANEFAEEFTLRYTDPIYHFTLFYYDQVGNLTKTVPPKGVDLLDDTEIGAVRAHRENPANPPVTPGHRMATIYAYNSLNQVIRKTTPDDGDTRYAYDELGRIILSQNAEQIAGNQAIYNLYDSIGRTVESGRLEQYAIVNSSLPYQTLLRFVYPLRAKSSVYRTVYDRPVSAEISSLAEGGQQNLRNRVATVLYQENYNADSRNFDHATHFSYDILGNVKELVQDFPALRTKYHPNVPLEQTRKKVQYQYDLVSGKVTRVHYQPGRHDQFIHWYQYDADNRLLQVNTGVSLHEDDEIRDIDARYYYYKHGPLARVELGREKVQGIDYAYTLQGWLKGINAGTLDPNRDMGRDGAPGSPHRNVAKDVFGFNLGYFEGDYVPIHFEKRAETTSFLPSVSGSALQAPGLYNGNIRFTTSAIAGLTENPIQGYLYRYDQLSRLTDMQIFRQAAVQTTNTWQGGSLVEDYRMQLRYDANGNITRLRRNTTGGALMDDLRYVYPDSMLNNRLGYITDPVNAVLSDLDIDNQAPGNYAYDRIGRNTRDIGSGVDLIRWNTLDRVEQVTRDDGSVIRYAYDAFGRRALKTVTAANGTVSGTYYVTDAKGAILAQYDISNPAADPDVPEVFRHVTNQANTKGYLTVLDHPVLNGNPDALLFIMPNYNVNGAGAAGVDYPENAGVWYDGARWTIFNQDTTRAMPLSLTFNVLIAPANHPNCFTVTCTPASKSGQAANTMAIDHLALNDKPNLSLLVTQNRLSAFNDNSQVVAYGAPGRWFIANNRYFSPDPAVSQRSTMPVGARFNIMVIENGVVPGFPEARAFMHTADAANTIPAGQNITFLDQSAANGNTRAMIWATPNWGWSPWLSAGQTSGPYNDGPVEAWYDHPNDPWDYRNGSWALYHGDDAPMPAGAKFNVVVMNLPALRLYAVFGHGAAASNISGHETVIDHPALNNNPHLIVHASADYREAYNAAPHGVRFDGARWRVYNLDRSPMPPGARFNVLAEVRGANHFVHTAAAGNTGNPAPYVTKLDHPRLNGNPSAILLVTPIPGSANNTSQATVWYTADGRWNIYNESLAAMPAGAAFHVSILPPSADARMHASTSANIWGQVPSATETNFTGPQKLLFLTHNGTSGDMNPNPCGVYFPPGRNAWSILTGNSARMTENRRFNVAAFDPVTPAAAPAVTTASVQWTQSPIYGAARLGMYQSRRDAVSGIATAAPMKAYELTDHIGNVLSVVADRKLPDSTGGWRAWTLLAQDYYPFGMEMPGREQESAGLPKYPFAYQGMEQDNAQKGEGNAYTTEYRQYDARVGRWLGVDMMQDSFPSISSFSTFANDPINVIDPSGLYIAYINSSTGTINRIENDEVLSNRSHGIRFIDSDGTVSQQELSFNDQEGDIARMNFLYEHHRDLPAVINLTRSRIREILDGELPDALPSDVYEWIEQHSGGPGAPLMLGNQQSLDFWRGVLVPEEIQSRGYGPEFSTPSLDRGPFFVFANAHTGRVFNSMDAGNFLWGAAVSILGIDEYIAQWGAEFNNIHTWWDQGAIFSDRSFMDDSEDQDAIELGHRYGRRWWRLIERRSYQRVCSAPPP